MFDIGTPELIVILLIILVFTGGKKLPELSKSLGDAVRQIRKGFNDEPEKDDKKLEESTRKTTNSKKKSKAD